MLRTLREKPADFDDVFASFTGEDLMARYNVSYRVLLRWLNGRKPKGQDRDLRPLPSDFVEMAKTMTWRGACKHYRTSGRIITRWAKESGATFAGPSVTKPRRPVPSDFHEIAPTMTRTAMTRHYRTKIEVINRWLSETGVKARTPVSTRPHRKVSLFTGYKRSYGNLIQTTTFTIYDEAADTLRRFCPVYRCTEKGAADPKGAFWRMGMSIMTPDELLVRAERKRAA